MINIIGIKRLIILAIMVALNASVGAALYLYFKPAKTDIERELRTTKSAISADRTLIAKRTGF